MKTQDKATPRPWKIRENDGSSRIYIEANGGEGIPFSLIGYGDSTGSIAVSKSFSEYEANAKLIVEAVNNYETLKAQRDALLEAISEAREWLNKYDYPIKAEEILEKAEEENA